MNFLSSGVVRAAAGASGAAKAWRYRKGNRYNGTAGRFFRPFGPIFFQTKAQQKAPFLSA
jgi:hypothetical protein